MEFILFLLEDALVPSIHNMASQLGMKINRETVLNKAERDIKSAISIEILVRIEAKPIHTMYIIFDDLA